MYVFYLNVNAKNSDDYFIYIKALTLCKYTVIITIVY